jgi:radical SAM protein with 4Fe4S-binding SPASM domain
VKRASQSGQAFKILKLSMPAYAYLETTYACEGTCPGCPAVAASDRSALLSASQWAPLIKGLAQSLEEVRLTGGEPTLHPDFLQILQSLKSERLAFKIYTNGLWPNSGGLLRALKGNPFFRGFIFSLHGSTPSIHHTFSGLSDFERITATIQEAVKRGFPVSTSTVLGHYNRGNIPGILKLASMLGSRKHHFRRYIGAYRAMISMNREDIAAMLEAIDTIPPEIFSYRTGECFPRCFYRRSLPCLAGITHITITPSGLVKACPFSLETHGTVKSGRIGGKRKIMQWVSDFTTACLHCDEIENCMGGCRVMRRNFLFKRDPLMEEPMGRDTAPLSIRHEKPIILNGFLRLKAMVRRESFGHVLIMEGEVIPVKEKALEVLKLCDGTKTIGEIGERADEQAKEFLLSLYLRGFIELV